MRRIRNGGAFYVSRDVALMGSDADWRAVANSLRTAAGCYDKAATLAPEQSAVRMEFRKRAAEARQLADTLAGEAGV